jgi:hypothetical protein
VLIVIDALCALDPVEVFVRLRDAIEFEILLVSITFVMQQHTVSHCL